MVSYDCFADHLGVIVNKGFYLKLKPKNLIYLKKNSYWIKGEKES